MHIERLHDWQVSPEQARRLQIQLADKVNQERYTGTPRYIAGIDVSVNMTENTARAAVVVLSYPELKPVEIELALGRPEFPYIPGLLSFREAPLTLEVCEKLSITPDLFMVDGQGIAHPRRMGIAAHLGLFLNVPTIGCAKSHLYGSYTSPPAEKGSYSELIADTGEVIGAVLRTRTGVNPVFVSTGHKIDLPTAISWVLNCCRGYRLPEPARMAHLASKGILKSESVIAQPPLAL